MVTRQLGNISVYRLEKGIRNVDLNIKLRTGLYDLFYRMLGSSIACDIPRRLWLVEIRVCLLVIGPYWHISLTGSLTLSQEGPDDQLNVSGDVSDLPEGRLLLAVVQGGCDAPFEDVQGKEDWIELYYSWNLPEKVSFLFPCHKITLKLSCL